MCDFECRSKTLYNSINYSINAILECETTYIISKKCLEHDHTKGNIKEIYRPVIASLRRYIQRYRGLLTESDYFILMNVDLRDKTDYHINTLYMIYRDLERCNENE